MKQKKLNPPSKDFLAELTERAKRYGWEGDYEEIGAFVRSLYAQAGIPHPDLTPYPENEELPNAERTEDV